MTGAAGVAMLVVAVAGVLSMGGRPATQAAGQLTTQTQVGAAAHPAARTAQRLIGPPSDSSYALVGPRASRDEARVPLGDLAEPGSADPAAGQGTAAAGTTTLASSAPHPGRADKRSAGNTWVLPTSHFYIGTWFGVPGWYWASGYHTGIDFVTACGTPEVAVTAGVVAQAGWDGPYGNQVRLQLPNGDQVWYNHMVQIKTRLGAHLKQGGLVGLAGETGNAYGCHLHLEYRLAGDLDTAVNPAPYFGAHGLNLHLLPTSPIARR